MKRAQALAERGCRWCRARCARSFPTQLRRGVERLKAWRTLKGAELGLDAAVVLPQRLIDRLRNVPRRRLGARAGRGPAGSGGRAPSAPSCWRPYHRGRIELPENSRIWPSSVTARWARLLPRPRSDPRPSRRAQDRRAGAADEPGSASPASGARGARALRLTHPNIVTIYEIGARRRHPLHRDGARRGLRPRSGDDAARPLRARAEGSAGGATSAAGSTSPIAWASSTATSSPRTSGSRTTARSRSSTSASRAGPAARRPTPTSRRRESCSGLRATSRPSCSGRQGRPPRRHVGRRRDPPRDGLGRRRFRGAHDHEPDDEDHDRAAASARRQGAAVFPTGSRPPRCARSTRTPSKRFPDLDAMAKALLAAIGPRRPRAAAPIRSFASARTEANCAEARRMLAEEDLTGALQAARRAQSLDRRAPASSRSSRVIEERLRSASTLQRPPPRCRPGRRSPTRPGSPSPRPRLSASGRDRARGCPCRPGRSTRPRCAPAAPRRSASSGCSASRRPPRRRRSRRSATSSRWQVRTGDPALSAALPQPRRPAAHGPPPPARATTRRRSRLAFSPDGSLLASAHVDGVVHLWDMATRDEIDVKLRHDHETVEGDRVLAGRRDARHRARTTPTCASSTWAPRSPARRGASWRCAGRPASRALHLGRAWRRGVDPRPATATSVLRFFTTTPGCAAEAGARRLRGPEALVRPAGALARRSPPRGWRGHDKSIDPAPTTSRRARQVGQFSAVEATGHLALLPPRRGAASSPAPSARTTYGAALGRRMRARSRRTALGPGNDESPVSLALRRGRTRHRRGHLADGRMRVRGAVLLRKVPLPHPSPPLATPRDRSGPLAARCS